MFNRIQSHLTRLTNTIQSGQYIPIEALIDLWVDTHVDLQDINKDEIKNVNNKEALAYSLYPFAAIFSDIIKTQSEIIHKFEDEVKEDIFLAEQDLQKIAPVIKTIYAEIEVMRAKRAMLRSKNEELEKLQDEKPSLINEIELLNIPELGKLDRLRSEIQSLRTECEKLSAEKDLLNDEKNYLVGNRDAIDSENNNLKREVSGIKQTIDVITTEIERLKVEQSEEEKKYEQLKFDKDALSPEQQRRRYEALLNEARPLIESYEAISSDKLYADVFSNVEGKDVPNALHSIKHEIDALMQEFTDEIMKRWESYGKLLAEWESLLKNIVK